MQKEKPYHRLARRGKRDAKTPYFRVGVPRHPVARSLPDGHQVEVQQGYGPEHDHDLGDVLLVHLCQELREGSQRAKFKEVPSQMPGYKPSAAEQKQDNAAYQYGVNALNGNANHDNMRFNSKKNELVAQETTILNEIGFDLDSYPSFFEIVDIFMA
eukprot:CAMPEP_0170490158 /NCGR_PEP_ID=MMETSP0208-20121228/8410_1 /TAXON_ID=197538 /ORGANISM="Strombidium inclinatum, Strain S3" /LENGTH=156 /DNA_ID=CAMNT_0010765427 /DNA_START=644 /DNA_END=1116 /DNA_ORIENTATION=+